MASKRVLKKIATKGPKPLTIEAYKDHLDEERLP